MNIKIKIFSVLILLFTVKVNFAQVESIPYYDHLNFHGSFFVIAESDERSNYYVVDLNQFETLIEKKYFEELAFSENEIVRIDAGNSTASWFKVDKTIPSSDINTIFSNLKISTSSAVSSMTDAQRQEWVQNHSK